MKLTPTQILVLRNIRDHGFHAATGFNGMSERGGAVKSVDSLRRRGLVDGPHRSEHLTEDGKEVLAAIEAAKTAERNAGMTNAVRRVLRQAGYLQAVLPGEWGYEVTPATTPGLVRLRYVPSATGSSLKTGNTRISEYVRVLQNNGFVARRVPGVTEVDHLLITRKTT